MTNNMDQELNQIINEEDNSLYNELKEQSWSIKDLDTAIWADSKINDYNLKIEEIDNAAKKQIEFLKEKIKKIEEWSTQQKNEPLNSIEFFKQHIFIFHKNLMEKQKNENQKVTTSLKFPFFSSSFRKQQPAISFDDKPVTEQTANEKFIKLTESIKPELIKKEVKWGELKKFLGVKEINGKKHYINKETGEIIEEIKLTDQANSFNMSANKKAKEEE